LFQVGLMPASSDEREPKNLGKYGSVEDKKMLVTYLKKGQVNAKVGKIKERGAETRTVGPYLKYRKKGRIRPEENAVIRNGKSDQKQPGPSRLSRHSSSIFRQQPKQTPEGEEGPGGTESDGARKVGEHLMERNRRVLEGNGEGKTEIYVESH
jgi:hypothetical protein